MTTDTHIRRAAVIGLGSMGSGMAGSLLRAGFTVAACDVNPDAVARFEAAGGRGADRGDHHRAADRDGEGEGGELGGEILDHDVSPEP